MTDSLGHGTKTLLPLSPDLAAQRQLQKKGRRQMHWHKPVTSALRRQRPEEHQEFGASLIYIATLSQQNKKERKRKGERFGGLEHQRLSKF